MANDLRISGAQTSPRSESDIRINYGNANQVIAASNDIQSTGTQAQFYSSDGGGSWSQTNLSLTGGDNLHSDPAVDWTSDGTAWAITIGIQGATNRLRCYKSSDGGATWTYDADASGTQTNVDKELMWVDRSPTSAHKDNIYVTWHNGGPSFVNRRTGPGGAWQIPVQVSGAETSASIGGDVTTDADGNVYAFWPDTSSKKLLVAKSTDGGATFAAPVTIATTFTSYEIQIPAMASRQALIYISAGAFKGTTSSAYAVWVDLSGESGCTSGGGPGTDVTSSCKSRIWFSRSTDGGSTWEPARMLNNQPSKNDQFNPRLSVDQTNGQLVVMYYDTVNDSARVKTDVFVQTSPDGGVTWSGAVQVTSGETDETAGSADSGNQYGDYNGLSGHAGRFFPSWTDRRSGSFEEIWTAPIVTKRSTFILNRNPIGQDEVDARRKQPAGSLGGLPIRDAFRVVVDGFTAAELGLTGSGSALSSLPVVSPATGITISASTPVANTAENGDYGTEIQRFTFYYDVDFADGTDPAFSFLGQSEDLTLNVTAGGVLASAVLTLIKQPDPFLLHGDPAWLSIDLRLFVVRPNETWFGVTMGGSAPDFIQQVMKALTDGHGTAGGQSFDDANVLSPDEDNSKLYLQPQDENSVPVFNFALAKVHYIGLIGATNVRTFFRLRQTQVTYASYDYPPGAQYRRATTNPDGQAIALAGIQNGEYVTVPCFALPRVNSTISRMDQQTDSRIDGSGNVLGNVQTITALSDGSEVDMFFGCWVDINQPDLRLPVEVPPQQDGPFDVGDSNPNFRPLSLKAALARNLHLCLIAEVNFDPTPIPLGKDPSNWDKLAQRNIAWSDAGSAQSVTTFEIRPTPTGLPADQSPDELMIDWNNIPSGTTAQIYLPAVKVETVIGMADRMYTSHRLTRFDGHTLQCTTGGISYVPIPPGAGINYAGLLTVDLPAGLRRGEVFNVVVRQLTNAFGKPTPPPPPPPNIAARRAAVAAVAAPAELEWRRVLGAFQLTIPVQTKEVLLVREERDLSVLRWIAEAIPHHSRWYPVFHRYLAQIAGRVTTFGGDPTQILPSPTGEGRRKHHRREEPEGEERRAFTGKIAGLIFDRFGDFEGFLLDTEDGERKFVSREKEIEQLAERAWRERLRITVWSERHEAHRPERIIIREPPAPFSN